MRRTNKVAKALKVIAYVELIVVISILLISFIGTMVACTSSFGYYDFEDFIEDLNLLPNIILLVVGVFSFVLTLALSEIVECVYCMALGVKPTLLDAFGHPIQ